MRRILTAAVTALCLLGHGLSQGASAQANCAGTDLIDALSPEDRGILQAASDAHPYAHGLFWRATKGAQTIHLLGTYHMPDPRHAAMLDRVTPILAQSKALLVEASPAEEARLKAEILKRPDFMFLNTGPTMPQLLNAAEWSDLSDEMKARGVPSFMAAKFRPWYLSLMLSIAPCAMEGLKSGGRGLDHQIMALAAERNIPISALEPYDTLFSIFGDLTMEEELEMVRAALLMAARPEDMAVTLANTYFDGQPRLIWEFSEFEAMRTPNLSQEVTKQQFELMDDVMMVRRNQRWISILTQAAAQHTQVFTAFGALHLSGEQGVLALLEQQGFTIERLDS